MLPRKPERPLDSDCCGQGCNPCVLDLYAEELAIWEAECQQVLSGEPAATDEAGEVEHVSPVLSQTEYKSFTIKSVTKVTEDTNIYRIQLPAGVTLGLQTGQHIVIRGEFQREVITRQYTPISDVKRTSCCDLLIKLYEHGKMSQYVKTWTVGSQIQIRGPFGSLQYQANKYRTIYMLAVGTGIAPMCQVIQTILGCDDDETVIHLHYGCRTYQNVLVKSYLDEWQRYWNFSCTYYLSQETEPATGSLYRYGDKVWHGKIDKAVIKTLIPVKSENFLVLFCGTRSFEKDVIECLNDLGLPQEKIHKF